MKPLNRTKRFRIVLACTSVLVSLIVALLNAMFWVQVDSVASDEALAEVRLFHWTIFLITLALYGIFYYPIKISQRPFLLMALVPVLTSQVVTVFLVQVFGQYLIKPFAVLSPVRLLTIAVIIIVGISSFLIALGKTLTDSGPSTFTNDAMSGEVES